MVIKTYTEDDLCLNVLLTSVCNARCSWCIANEYMSRKKTFSLMPEENVQELIKRLKKESVKQVNLLGGEPSLHPNALDIGKRIYDLGIPVGFSTNGLWNDDFRKLFERISYPLEAEITYLGSQGYSEENKKRLQRTFEQLRTHPTSLGLIITSLNQPYGEHLDIVKKYGFDLRWAFLEPTIRSGQTEGYKTQRNIQEMGKHVSNIVREANQRGLDTWADLTVPRCAISDSDMNIYEGDKNDIQFKCPPFFDISPTLDIWRCLPMAPEQTLKLTNFDSFKEAYQRVNQIKQKYIGGGSFDECGNCKYLDDLCSGGPAISKRLK